MCWILILHEARRGTALQQVQSALQKVNETPEERMARLEKEAYEAQEKAKQAMEANRLALSERQVLLPSLRTLALPQALCVHVAPGHDLRCSAAWQRHLSQQARVHNTHRRHLSSSQHAQPHVAL